ncbi:hypothetical protein pb186bvf_014422 [Paramecium bursaria]
MLNQTNEQLGTLIYLIDNHLDSLHHVASTKGPTLTSTNKLRGDKRGQKGIKGDKRGQQICFQVNKYFKISELIYIFIYLEDLNIQTKCILKQFQISFHSLQFYSILKWIIANTRDQIQELNEKNSLYLNYKHQNYKYIQLSMINFIRMKQKSINQNFEYMIVQVLLISIHIRQGQSGATCGYCQICDTVAVPASCNQCDDGYFQYQATNHYSCAQCSSECSKCVGVATYCTECSYGYYMQSLLVCGTCDYPCSTCGDNLGCLTCVDNYFVDSQSCSSCDPNCITCEFRSTNCYSCINKYYLENDNTCQQCPIFCDICTKLECQVCIDANAELPQCTCKDGYYQNLQQCNQCSSICATCQNQATNCLTCSGSNRNASNQCNCDTGYIELSGVCRQCASPCSTCQTTQVYCTACTNSNMVLNSGVCTLQQINLYQPCDLKCKTCQNFNQCLSCQDVNHILTFNQECICQMGYLEIADTCIQCQAPCFACHVNPSQCTECIDSNQILTNNTCVCPQGQYYSNENSICKLCDNQCTTCISQNFCQNCAEKYYLFNNQCLPCQINCQTCLDQNICQTCISGYQLSNSTCINTNSLNCQVGYFKNNQNICTQCQLNCLSCETFEYKCLSCNNQMILSQNQCLCNQGYFYEDSLCKICHPSCLTCIKHSLCTSCDFTLNRVLEIDRCNCMNGYYDNGEIQCLLCENTIEQEECNYSNCNDGIWTWGEQCDDNNSNYRDGCSNCKLDQGYYCSNIILQPSQCAQCPQYCQKCSENLICSICYDGYFLEFNLCVQCSNLCKTCKLYNQCTTCKYLDLNGKCAYCDDRIGYYYDIDMQNCKTICGDNIKADTEQCDDGNILNDDGCDNLCQLESGYHIYNGLIQIIAYPKPYLTENNLQKNQLFNNTRLFQLIYEQKLQYFDLITSDQLQINIGELLINRDYNMTIFDHSFRETNEYLIINLTIQIDLQSSLNQQYLEVYFYNPSQIKSLDGFEQQVREIKTLISDFEYVDQQTKDSTEQSINSTSYLLYIILGLVLLSILFGGIDIFFNLLELLQFISYLQYVNTQFPYNLETFLNIFAFIQLQILGDYIDYNQYIVDFKQLKQSPSKIQDDGFTPNIIVNLQSIIVVWSMFMITYLLAHLIPFLLNQFRIQIYSNDRIFKVYLKILILFIESLILNLCKQIQRSFIYSGLFRTYLSSAYDFCFYITLNLYVLSFVDDNLINIFASYITIICLFIYCFILFMALRVVQLKSYILIKNNYRWGSIYEGLQLKSRYKKYYNIFLLSKRLLFMIFIVLLYQWPIFQITGLMSLSIFQIYYLCFNPLKEQMELRKQLICEIYIFLLLINIFILVFDDLMKIVQRSYIGWICICLIMLLLFTQIVFDAIQQWTILIKVFNKIIKGNKINLLLLCSNCEIRCELYKQSLIFFYLLKHYLQSFLLYYILSSLFGTINGSWYYLEVKQVFLKDQKIFDCLSLKSLLILIFYHNSSFTSLSNCSSSKLCVISQKKLHFIQPINSSF